MPAEKELYQPKTLMVAIKFFTSVENSFAYEIDEKAAEYEVGKVKRKPGENRSKAPNGFRP